MFVFLVELRFIVTGRYSALRITHRRKPRYGFNHLYLIPIALNYYISYWLIQNYCMPISTQKMCFEKEFGKIY